MKREYARADRITLLKEPTHSEGAALSAPSNLFWKTAATKRSPPKR
jgi:hypothetical protein